MQVKNYRAPRRKSAKNVQLALFFSISNICVYFMLNPREPLMLLLMLLFLRMPCPASSQQVRVLLISLHIKTTTTIESWPASHYEVNLGRIPSCPIYVYCIVNNKIRQQEFSQVKQDVAGNSLSTLPPMMPSNCIEPSYPMAYLEELSNDGMDDKINLKNNLGNWNWKR